MRISLKTTSTLNSYLPSILLSVRISVRIFRSLLPCSYVVYFQSHQRRRRKRKLQPHSLFYQEYQLSRGSPPCRSHELLKDILVVCIRCILFPSISLSINISIYLSSSKTKKYASDQPRILVTDLS